jgi:hypothetical protein
MLVAEIETEDEIVEELIAEAEALLGTEPLKVAVDDEWMTFADSIPGVAFCDTLDAVDFVD